MICDEVIDKTSKLMSDFSSLLRYFESYNNIIINGFEILKMKNIYYLKV